MDIKTITKKASYSLPPSSTLSDNALLAFCIIYFNEFGEKISVQEAQRMGMNFLLLFKRIYRPLPKTKEVQPDGKE